MSDDLDPTTAEFPAVDRRGHGKLYDDENHPKARKSDGGWRFWCIWLYHKMLPLVCLVVALVALGLAWTRVDRAEFKAERAAQIARSQREGRTVAVDVLCGGVAGIEDAGTQALQGKLEGQNGHGLPQRAIDDYVRTISRAVSRQAGVDARRVLKANGTIDCDRLRVAARATHP